MSAIQFIKAHGVEKARGVVEGAPAWATNFNTQVGYTKASNGGEYTVYINQRTGDEEYSLQYEMGIDLPELNRLIQSVDLVKLLGGIISLKALVDLSNTPFALSHFTREGVIYSIDEIKKAITDYEQLFGNTETLGGEHV